MIAYSLFDAWQVPQNGGYTTKQTTVRGTDESIIVSWTSTEISIAKYDTNYVEERLWEHTF